MGAMDKNGRYTDKVLEWPLLADEITVSAFKLLIGEKVDGDAHPA
jgi:hypothetical protein